MKAPWTVCAAACLAALPALADGTDGTDPGGTLNPEELTLPSIVDRAQRGEDSMTVCMYGYYAVKGADHAEGGAILDACADRYTAAMHWQSYMELNGLGRPEDPAMAAEWARRAAERGDPIGQYNHGLDLLRGYGVQRDPIRGRQMIDRAAAQGLAQAERLRASGYDPEEATPDADRWKYQGTDPVW